MWNFVNENISVSLLLAILTFLLILLLSIEFIKLFKSNTLHTGYHILCSVYLTYFLYNDFTYDYAF